MKRRQISDQFQRAPYIPLTLAMSSGEASQFSMYPQVPQTWITGLTAAKMFHRLTLIRFPAPPGSRFPGTSMMSLDWHFGHRFSFFIAHPSSVTPLDPPALVFPFPITP
jgi:hypothetical protein